MRRIALSHGAFFRRETTKIVVVKHHRLIVTAQLQVNLDPVARSNRRRDARARILGAACGQVMQAPMGKGDTAETVGQRAHLIWNTPSISTATPKGREGADTAARACLPASPKASPIKSDAPLITAGC